MSWIKNTQFADHVKDFTYEQCLETWGEKHGKEVAAKFNIKQKRKKKEQPKEEEGE